MFMIIGCYDMGWERWSCEVKLECMVVVDCWYVDYDWVFTVCDISVGFSFVSDCKECNIM
jgi:hypothetical protein